MSNESITDRMLANEVVHRQALEVYIKTVASQLDAVQTWDDFERVLAEVTPVAKKGLPRELWLKLSRRHWQRVQP